MPWTNHLFVKPAPPKICNIFLLLFIYIPYSVHSFIISHLDHCNVFLTCLSPLLFIRSISKTLVWIFLFFLKKHYFAYWVSLKWWSMIFNKLIICVPICLFKQTRLFLNYLGSLIYTYNISEYATASSYPFYITLSLKVSILYF